MYVGLFKYFVWMLVKGIAVICVRIYCEFDYKQRYIFNILYGELLIKTDASCTCLIIICHLICFARPRGKYVSCLNSTISTCSSFYLYYIYYDNCSILLTPRCIWLIKRHFLSWRQDTTKNAWSHNPIFMSLLTFPYTAPLYSAPV